MRHAYFISLLIGLACGQMLRGINYGNQDASGNCKSYNDIVADFKFIATFAQAVKIYSLGDCMGGQTAVQAAGETGIKVFLGMAAGPDWAYQNELRLLRELTASHGLSNVIGISVGTEDLYRGEVSASTIAAEIVEVQGVVRGAGFSVPVTHTDAVPTPPEILAVEDIMMYNIFPFWQGVDIPGALGALIGNYEFNKNIAMQRNLPVWIGETGWPSAGGHIGAAYPTEENAGKFLQAFVCWANANNVPYFYFEAFDEPWKKDVEGKFGMFNYDRSPKSYSYFTCDGGNQTPTPLPSPTATGNPHPTTSTTSSTIPLTTSSTSSTVATTSSVAEVAVTTQQPQSTSADNAPVATQSTVVAATQTPAASGQQQELATVVRQQGSATRAAFGILAFAAAIMLL